MLFLPLVKKNQGFEISLPFLALGKTKKVKSGDDHSSLAKIPIKIKNAINTLVIYTKTLKNFFFLLE